MLAARSGSLEGAQLVVHGPDGTVAPENVTVLPGPTALLAATLPPASAGRFTARVVAADGSELACRTLDVAHESSPRARRNLGRFAGVWPIEAEWDARHEVLFSAWIARLFYVEPDAFAGWNPLHRVFRDPARNVLFDHLGLGEDSRSPRVVMRADCADTLYGLRAYFAWKMRLPFLVHRCNRGTAIRGPRCRGVISNLLGVRAYGPDPVRRFSKFMHRVFETVVHSGTTRTMPDAERSDFYPIAIDRTSLRPGTVFVVRDSHVLMVSQWTDPAPGRLGALFAIDGHPGFSVTHRRFTPGSFPFSPWVPTDGFKAFRPALLDGANVRPMSDDEIRARPFLAQPSNEQLSMTRETFYARMATLQNPTPVDPAELARAAVEELHAIATARVALVDASSSVSGEIPMPEHAFSSHAATTDWRRLATGRIDLRMLLAMDRLGSLSRRAEREPHLFVRPWDDDSTRAVIDAELARRSIRYRRSDGTGVTVSLAELVSRKRDLTLAFNPNDCPEIRWADPDLSACVRRAPQGQRWIMRRKLLRYLVAREDPTGR